MAGEQAEQTNEPADVEREARSMGWIPEAEFKGDKAAFVPAEEFVRRGREVIPFLRANNRRLESEVTKLRGELTQSQTLLRESSEAIENLKEFQSSIALERVKTKKTEVIAAISKARENGDIEAEANLTDELSTINTALKDSAKKVEKKAEPVAPVQPAEIKIEPVTQNWMTANPWFGKTTKEERRKTEMAIAISKEIKEENPALVNEDFFTELDSRLSEFFGTGQAPSKVEETRSANGRGGSPATKGYAQLPADAKAAAQRLESKMVGKGRGKFETADLWRKHYAEQYWSQE